MQNTFIWWSCQSILQKKNIRETSLTCTEIFRDNNFNATTIFGFPAHLTANSNTSSFSLESYTLIPAKLIEIKWNTHNFLFYRWRLVTTFHVLDENWCSPCNLGGIVPRVSCSNSIDFIWYFPIYSAKIGSDVLLIIPQIACRGNKTRLHYLGMLIFFRPFPWQKQEQDSKDDMNDMSEKPCEEFEITLSR